MKNFFVLMLGITLFVMLFGGMILDSVKLNDPSEWSAPKSTLIMEKDSQGVAVQFVAAALEWGK